MQFARLSAEPLITASDLRALRNAVVLDARPGDAAYGAGHLAGAWHADLNTQLSAATAAGADPRRGGRHPLPSIDPWARQLGAWGITPATPVVIYDDADGANAAARAWWMLRAVGHDSVRVLDGGFRAAVAAGLPVTTDVPIAQATSAYPITSWRMPTVGIDEVDAARRDRAWKVLDVRSAPRFRAETEPIDPVAGHIPGAVNLPFADNMAADRFKTADELRRQYEALLDGTPVERLIVHCGSGVTACHTLLALELAGLSGASLYVGSWSEWCRNDMPIGMGE